MAQSVSDLIIDELVEFKTKPSQDNLGFGKHFTDRMLLGHWKDGQWTFRITNYRPLEFEPATVVFHYGQAIFEGMKAYRHPDGTVNLFRPHLNAERFNLSAKRMVMPEIDPQLFVEYIQKLVALESDWVPNTPGSSLYVRPTMIASEPVLGVKPAKEYTFFVILSPSGPYFSTGLNPTRIKVEETYVRAVEGGTGGAKAAANYAGSLLASKIATEQGYNQVLWLDAQEKRYIEEVGSMNIAFVIDGIIHSPAPRGTILDGITRRSVKIIAEDLEIPFNEGRITIDQVIESIKDGSLTEIFGIGTAAVINPVGTLGYRGTDYEINKGQIGPIASQLYEQLVGIQLGTLPDPHNWMLKVA